MTEIVATDMVPLRERGKWFGFISSMWALGTVAGPLLGGGFAQNVSWTWIFWINLPFIGIGAAMIILFLKLNYQTSSFIAKLRRVDWIGSIVFVGATTGFLIPVSFPKAIRITNANVCRSLGAALCILGTPGELLSHWCCAPQP